MFIYISYNYFYSKTIILYFYLNSSNLSLFNIFILIPFIIYSNSTSHFSIILYSKYSTISIYISTFYILHYLLILFSKIYSTYILIHTLFIIIF
jgi:hypothetical protein